MPDRERSPIILVNPIESLVFPGYNPQVKFSEQVGPNSVNGQDEKSSPEPEPSATQPLVKP